MRNPSLLLLTALLLSACAVRRSTGDAGAPDGALDAPPDGGGDATTDAMADGGEDGGVDGAADGPVDAPLDGDAADGAVGPEPCTELEARTPAAEVFIAPTGLPAYLGSYIAGATESLWVTTYQLGNDDMRTALEDAARRGVDVRVMLDGEQRVNQYARTDLLAAGAAVQYGPSEFSHFHGKTMVRDGVDAIVMSANLNDYSLYSERNHGALLRDPWDVADLQALFEHDWAGATTDFDVTCTRLVVGPENSRERLTRLIRSAETELRMQELSFSDDDLRAEVLARAAAGVDVKVILAHPSWIDDNATYAAELIAGGAEARYLVDYDNHAKLIVSDEDRAYVGSTNISWYSLTRNREVGVVLTDTAPISTVVERFDADWTTAWEP